MKQAMYAQYAEDERIGNTTKKLMYTIIHANHTMNSNYAIERDNNRIVSMLPLFYTKISVIFMDDRNHVMECVSDCSLPHLELIKKIDEQILAGAVRFYFTIDDKPLFAVILAEIQEMIGEHYDSVQSS